MVAFAYQKTLLRFLRQGFLALCLRVSLSSILGSGQEQAIAQKKGREPKPPTRN
jgi:hypothetical protein